MGKPAILAIKVVSDAKQATTGLKQAETAVGRFQGGLKKASTVAVGVGVGLAAMAVNAGQSASALEQAQGAVDSVFGAQSGAVTRLAKDAANSVGLAQAQYSDLAAVLGSQLKNLGIDQTKIIGTTDGLITKGADLAATFGGTTSEAVEALSAAFRGETDPIEKYGISIKAADVKARMAADGTSKLTGEAGKQARTQALLALINEQSAAATGQFGREQNSAAGSAQIAAANYENAKAALGDALLPAMTAGAQAAAKLATFVQQNAKAFTIIAAVVGGVAAAILAAQAASMIYSVALGIQAVATGAGTAALAGNSIALGAYAAAAGVARAASLAWAGVQWVLNAAMAANPIMLVVIAIAALVAGIIWAWNNVSWFRDGIIAAWNWIKTASVAVWNFIKQAIGVAWQGIVWWFQNMNPVGIIITHWAAIKAGAIAAWNWIKTMLAAVWQGIVWAFKNLSPVGFIITHWSRIRAATSAAWAFVKAYIARLWAQIVTNTVGRARSIVASIVGAWARVKAMTSAAWAYFRAIIASRVAAAMATVRAVPARIRAAFANMGSMLLGSGRRLIDGFVRGIRNSIGRVKSAASSVVRAARNFFPFSPAKEGPFSGSGYTTTSGRALVTDFASAMAARASLVRRAADRVATAGQIEGGYTLPTLSNAPGGAATSGMVVNNYITIEGAIDSEASARQIRRVLDDSDRRAGRKLAGSRR